MHRTPAAHRYTRRMWKISVLYIVLIAVNTAVKYTPEVSKLALALAALASAVPVVVMLVVLAIYLREETDEYVRDRSVISMLAGLGALLAASSVLGMLQLGGLVENLPIFLAFPLWCCVWGGTQAVLSWRDGRQVAQA